MLRPYIICHMTSSSDLKVTGSFLSLTECEGAIEKYYEIKKKVGYSYDYENKPLLTNSRQIGLLESSLKNINSGLKEIEKGTPVDLVSIDLSKALLDMEDILGNRSKVNLSEEIFSRFCLGK